MHMWAETLAVLCELIGLMIHSLYYQFCCMYLGSGCWLLLQSVDNLLPAVLHTMSVLLPQIQQAWLTKASSLPWLGESLSLNPGITPGICFATYSFPHGGNLSPDLRRAFVSCSVDPPERRVLMEALLLIHQFECHRQLAQTLDTVLTAVDELFNSHFSVVGEGEDRTVTLSKCMSSMQRTVPLGPRLLELIVTAGQKYTAEFEMLGLLQGGPLHDQSTVLSDMSEGARASLRLRATSFEQASRTHYWAHVCIHVHWNMTSIAYTV